MESLKGGVGVMMDDVLAGVYSFYFVSGSEMGDWLKKVGTDDFPERRHLHVLRAQLSAQMATIADFLVTILLVRLFDVYYVYATLAGLSMEESLIVLSTINGLLNRKERKHTLP